MSTTKWQRKKPTKPGEYLTRHADDLTNVNYVIITKVGRGLSVYCPSYDERVQLSEIGANELEWAEKE